eukprot:COSAG06_NODE_7947_length_2325_cov_18.452830_4_plen_86_part_00
MDILKGVETDGNAEAEDMCIDPASAATITRVLAFILALVFVYRTEVSNGRNTIVGLGVVFALIATWICASFEARLRAKTGSPIGE